MSRPVWVAELADQFWRASGGRTPLPRDLRSPILWGWPLTVVALERLSVRAMYDWLARVGLSCTSPEADRPLRGGLAAWNGSGFLFVAADDDPPEQRFTIAHELAHFLRDYWQPRERAAAVLGPTARQIVDGLRAPRPEERLHALLQVVPLGLHTHLMKRGAAEDPHLLSAAESDADLLGCELLAPADEVFAHLPQGSEHEAAAALELTWGLPATVAHWYAALLFPSPQRDPFLRQLEKIFSRASNCGPSGGTT